MKRRTLDIPWKLSPHVNLPIFLLCHLEYFASDIPQNCHSWHRQSCFSFLLLLLCFINCPFSLPFNSPSPSLIVQSHPAPVNYLFSLMLFYLSFLFDIFLFFSFYLSYFCISIQIFLIPWCHICISEILLLIVLL